MKGIADYAFSETGLKNVTLHNYAKLGKNAFDNDVDLIYAVSKTIKKSKVILNIKKNKVSVKIKKDKNKKLILKLK